MSPVRTLLILTALLLSLAPAHANAGVGATNPVLLLTGKARPVNYVPGWTPLSSLNVPADARQTLVAGCDPGTVPYTDIDGSPFYDYIIDVHCRNIVEGYPDGSFRPHTNTERGTLVRWVVKARGWPLDTTGGPHFTDVPATDPLYPYVETAYNHGMISGYDEGTFRPTIHVTRGQMSKMVVLAWGWPLDTAGGPHFRDVDVGNPFYAMIETVYKRGLASGYPCAGLDPCPGIYFHCRVFNTRGQLTKVLFNALNAP